MKAKINKKVHEVLEISNFFGRNLFPFFKSSFLPFSVSLEDDFTSFLFFFFPIISLYLYLKESFLLLVCFKTSSIIDSSNLKLFKRFWIAWTNKTIWPLRVVLSSTEFSYKILLAMRMLLKSLERFRSFGSQKLF